MLLEIGLAQAGNNSLTEDRNDPYRINRLPKQIREQLALQNHASIPSSRYSRHKILTTPPQKTLTVTPKPNSHQAYRFNERKDQYRYRLRRTPEHKSDKQQSQPPSHCNYREMTRMDITLPLSKSQPKTIDDHYRVSPVKRTDYDLVPDPLHSPTPVEAQTKTVDPEELLVIVKSQPPTTDYDLGSASASHQAELKSSDKQSDTYVSKRWRSTNQPQNKASAFRLLLSNDPFEMVPRLDETYELTADRCKFQTADKTIQSKPSSIRLDTNHAAQETKRRGICTVPLLGKRTLNSSAPITKNKNLTHYRLHRRATSLTKATLDENAIFDTPDQFYHEIEEILTRKPVIPSLTQLTEVMNSSYNCRSPESTTNCRVYQSPEYKHHLIHKYHGDQIVVDSTNYDDFARK